MFPMVFLALGLLLASCTPEVTPSSLPDTVERAPVILVSLDGFRPDYLERGLTPTLAALAADGVLADAMRPSFPSITFPNHYTLVTGLYPDHHGIVHNRMEDAALAPHGVFTLGNREAMQDERWWDEATPLWLTARHRGVRSATMFWPGSDVAIHGQYPDYWLSYDKEMAPEARVDRVLDWLDLPSGQRPGFITLYFEHVDSAGHKVGLHGPALDGSLRLVDGALAHLVEGLRRRGLFDRVNLVILADHGMTDISPDRVVYLDDLIGAMDQVRVVTSGPTAGIEPRAGFEAAVEGSLIGPHPHSRCWRKSELPAAFHYGQNPRVPAIQCLAESGWLLLTRAEVQKDAAEGKTPMAGTHGYDPADPSMAALFLAHGPAFRPGYRQPVFDNVDVYPLLTELLGIEGEPNDGELAPLRGMLR